MQPKQARAGRITLAGSERALISNVEDCGIFKCLSLSMIPLVRQLRPVLDDCPSSGVSGMFAPGISSLRASGWAK
jgi:hypothetical protein